MRRMGLAVSIGIAFHGAPVKGDEIQPVSGLRVIRCELADPAAACSERHIRQNFPGVFLVDRARPVIDSLGGAVSVGTLGDL